MIISLDEKRGDIRHIEPNNKAFKDLISNLQLVDVENIHGAYTWTNRRLFQQQITCHLDYYPISKEMKLARVQLESSILPMTGSNHWPISLWVEFLGSPQWKPFWFEKICLTYLDFQVNGQQRWEEAFVDWGTLMYYFQQMLKFFKRHLKEWKKNVFENTFQAQKIVEKNARGSIAYSLARANQDISRWTCKPFIANIRVL